MLNFFPCVYKPLKNKKMKTDFTGPRIWTSSFEHLFMYLKTAGWMANSADSDQMQYFSSALPVPVLKVIMVLKDIFCLYAADLV